MSYNRVILMGNLTRDPETRYSSEGGKSVTKFGMAMNERWKDSKTGEKRESVTFVDVKMFGPRGEAFAKYHKKGDMAFVEGKLSLEKWDDKDTGQTKEKLNVLAFEWAFAGSKRDGGSAAPQGPVTPGRVAMADAAEAPF